METKDTNQRDSLASCPANDLTGSAKGLLLWCLPIVALIVGDSWAGGRPWLWIPALLVMGISCLSNAARCGRVHCYFTGPLFLIAAIYMLPAAFHLVPLNPGIFLDTVVVLTVLAYAAELPFGRYRKRA
jgi:hypothetical protein